MAKRKTITWMALLAGGGGVCLLALLFAAFMVTSGGPETSIRPRPKPGQDTDADPGATPGGKRVRPMPAPPVATDPDGPAVPPAVASPTDGNRSDGGRLEDLIASVENLAPDSVATGGGDAAEVMRLARWLDEHPEDAGPYFRLIIDREVCPPGLLLAFQTTMNDQFLAGAVDRLGSMAEEGGRDTPAFTRAIRLLAGTLTRNRRPFPLGAEARDRLLHAAVENRDTPVETLDTIALLVLRGSGEPARAGALLKPLLESRFGRTEPLADPLAQALAETEGKGVRTGAAEYLYDAGVPPAARAVLLQAMAVEARQNEAFRDQLGLMLRRVVDRKEDDAEFRASALRIMNESSTGLEAEELADRLAGESALSIRLAAAELLGQRSELSDDIRGTLLGAARQPGDVSIRVAAVRAIGKTGAVSDIEQLRSIGSSSDDPILQAEITQAVQGIELRARTNPTR